MITFSILKTICLDLVWLDLSPVSYNIGDEIGIA